MYTSRTIFIALLTFVFSYSYSQDSTKVPFKGIGLTYKMDSANKAIVVTRVFAGNAAAEAGVREGDLMEAINNTALWPLANEERSKLMRGGVNGDAYTLRLQRTIITSLGKKQEVKEVNLKPRLVETEICVSGNCKDGSGKMIDNATGTTKEGRFVNGDFVEGKTYFASGRIRTEGKFVNGLLEGEATTYHDVYEVGKYAYHRKGQFEKGILRKGNLFSKDGKTWWQGSFDEQGNPHGKGFIVRSPGFYYEGDMVHGELTGEAKSMTYQEGTYEGPVVKGKPEGKGTWYWSGRTHKGRFVNGLMEGQFRVTEKAGSAKYQHIYNYRNGVRV